MNPMKKAAPANEALVFDFKRGQILILWIDASGGAPAVRGALRVPVDGLGDESAARVKKALYAWEFPAAPRAILTWEEGILFRQFSLPDMPEADLRKAFLWEMSQKYSVSGEDHSVAYEQVADGEGDEGGRERFYSIFYAEKKTVAERIRFVKGLGFSVAAVVPGQAALAALAKKAVSNPAFDTLVFDGGFTTARVLIVRDGKNMLSRTVPIGGQFFTEALTQPFMRATDKVKFSSEEAEAFKLREGVSDPQASHIPLLRPYLEKMVAEIKRSADYYESQKFSRPIGAVLFTGGATGLKGLDGFMGRFLGMPVTVPDRGLFVAPAALPGTREAVFADFPAMASAIGAALTVGGPMDLLPVEYKESKRTKARRASLRVTLTIAAACLALLDAWTFSELAATRAKLAASEGEWREIERLKTLLADLSTQQKFVRSALKGDVSHPSLLKYLSIVTPPLVHLEGVDFDRDDGLLLIRGTVAAAEGSDVKVLARFISDLMASPFFADVTLTDSSRPEGSAKSKFEIRCVISGVA